MAVYVSLDQRKKYSIPDQLYAILQIFPLYLLVTRFFWSFLLFSLLRSSAKIVEIILDTLLELDTSVSGDFDSNRKRMIDRKPEARFWY